MQLLRLYKVVGCLKLGELVSWEIFPQGVRLEAFAVRGLWLLHGLVPVRLPLPDVSDPRSLKLGSVQAVLSLEDRKAGKLTSGCSDCGTLVQQKEAVRIYGAIGIK